MSTHRPPSGFKSQFAPLATAQKADQVFLPVLENASKAQKLRSTLGVFERSKFFFNLPGSLMESIEAVSPSLYSARNKYLISTRASMKPHYATTRKADFYWSHALNNCYPNPHGLRMPMVLKRLRRVSVGSKSVSLTKSGVRLSVSWAK